MAASCTSLAFWGMPQASPEPPLPVQTATLSFGMRYLSFCLLLLAACTSTGKKTTDGSQGLPSEIATEDYMDAGDHLALPSDLPIGAFLSDISNRIQAWSNARQKGDHEMERLLENVLKFDCLKRQGELIYQLEAGPARNRSLAAVALGFTNAHVIVDPDSNRDLIDRGASAISPLVAASMDENKQVAANALMGLGLLARIETPLGPICNALDSSTEVEVRTNASFALMSILDASSNCKEDFSTAQLTMVRESCQRSLVDQDLSVRLHCSATLGLAGNGESVASLGDRLDDDVAYVGQAAATSLARLGKDQPKLKGRIARLLAASLDRVRPSRREIVMMGLILLAEGKVGDETEDWMNWASRLPS
jgi:hypothetical protein